MSSIWGILLSALLIFSSSTPEQKALFDDLTKVLTWEVVKIHSSGEITTKEDTSNSNILYGGFDDLFEESQIEVTTIKYEVDGYFNQSNGEAYVKGYFGQNEKKVPIEIYLKEGLAYVNKELLVYVYPSGAYNQAPEPYIAYPLDLKEMMSQEEMTSAQEYKPLTDLIQIQVPLTKVKDTYNFEMDYKTFGEFFEKTANKVLNNIEPLAKEYIKIAYSDLTISKYDEKTGEYIDKTYDNVDAFYNGEMKSEMDEIISYAKEKHMIERISCFIKGALCGSQIKMQTTITEDVFSNEINTKLNFVNSYLVEAKLQTNIEKVAKQEVSTPTKVILIGDKEDYAYTRASYYKIMDGFKIDDFTEDEIKELKYEQYAFTDGKTYYIPYFIDDQYNNYVGDKMICYDNKIKKCYVIAEDNIDMEAYWEAEKALYDKGEIVDTEENDKSISPTDFIIDPSKIVYLEVIAKDEICLIPIDELKKAGLIYEIEQNKDEKQLKIYKKMFE